MRRPSTTTPGPAQRYSQQTSPLRRPSGRPPWRGLSPWQPPMADVLAVSVPLPPNPTGPIIDGVGNLIGGGARSIGESILSAVGQAIARGLADACRKVSDGLLHFLSSSAGVDFHA